MPRPQFRLRSLFILTALVAVGCLVIQFFQVAVPYWFERLSQPSQEQNMKWFDESQRFTQETKDMRMPTGLLPDGRSFHQGGVPSPVEEAKAELNARKPGQRVRSPAPLTND